MSSELQELEARYAMRHLRPGAGRVRARRGRAALGRRRARSTSTSSPGSRSTTPATATRGSSRRSREQAGALRRAPRTSSTPSRRCGSPSGWPSRASAGAVFLCNSGAEASECAIKLVRKRAHRRGIDRPEIVILDGAFHGRTLGALAATPRLARDDLFGPLPRGLRRRRRATTRDALRAAVGARTPRR